MAHKGADGVWVPYATFERMATNHIEAPSLRAEVKALTLEVKELRWTVDALKAAEALQKQRGDRLQLAYDGEHKELLSVLSARMTPSLLERLAPIAWTLLGVALSAGAFALAQPLSSLWRP